MGAPALAPSATPYGAPPATTADGKKLTQISASVSCVGKIPRCHQLDGINVIDPNLDSTLCGKCEQDELAVIVWMLTGIRPDFKLTDLRCGDYEAIADKYKFAANRLKEQSPGKYNAIVTKIHAFLLDEEISSV